MSVPKRQIADMRSLHLGKGPDRVKAMNMVKDLEPRLLVMSLRDDKEHNAWVRRWCTKGAHHSFLIVGSNSDQWNDPDIQEILEYTDSEFLPLSWCNRGLISNDTGEKSSGIVTNEHDLYCTFLSRLAIDSSTRKARSRRPLTLKMMFYTMLCITLVKAVGPVFLKLPCRGSSCLQLHILRLPMWIELSRVSLNG